MLVVTLSGTGKLSKEEWKTVRNYLGEVLACVSATGLFAGGGGGDGLDGALEEVAELKSLNEVPVCVVQSSALRGCLWALTHEFQIMLRSLMPTCS